MMEAIIRKPESARDKVELNRTQRAHQLADGIKSLGQVPGTTGTSYYVLRYNQDYNGMIARPMGDGLLVGGRRRT